MMFSASCLSITAGPLLYSPPAQDQAKKSWAIEEDFLSQSEPFVEITPDSLIMRFSNSEGRW